MSTKIKFNHPFDHQGTHYAEMEMRRPKVKDRLAAARKAGTDADKEVFLFARLCDVSPDVIEEMDADDYSKLQETLGSFFDSQTTKE